MHRAHTCALFLAASAVAFAQPSIDPPAGPIEESGRFGTLIELTQATAPGDSDSVFKISQPGSYVLTEDVVVPAFRIGIELASDDITLDLNGYAIRGETNSSNSGIALRPTSQGSLTLDNITVRNGIISGVEQAVRLEQFVLSFPNPSRKVVALNARIDGLTVDACTTGIEAEAAEISNCVIDVADAGIRNIFGSVTSSRVRVTERQSAGYGIRVNDGSVRDTSVEIETNYGDNAQAFDVDGSVVRGCIALTRGDLSTGFAYGTRGATVTDCLARRIGGNNTVGFNGDGVTSNSTAVGYFIGFACNDGLVRGCAAVDCTTDSDLAPGVTSADNSF